MSTDSRTGEMPAIPEDTLDLGDRLDPVRTLLRRTAMGDRAAAGSLVDVLGPRIHGLAVHVTGSSARAGKLTVSVLRSCLRDAAQLAASGLPGEAAVLDRARRAAVATEPSGDVRSLVAPDAVSDRTRDRREVTVMRALLDLPARERALVESAAQGRFPYTGTARQQPAIVLSHLLDVLVPFGEADGTAADGAGTGGHATEMRALAALDALALADDGERARLRTLTAGSEGAGVHRHAIEAAARLTLLTAVPPSRDLREAVLDGFGPQPPAQAAAPGPCGATPPGRAVGPTGPAAPAVPVPEPEAAYRGTYATPVLGTDTQQRVVGPPALTGGMHPGVPSQVSAPLQAGSPMQAAGPPPRQDGLPQQSGTAPAFAFSARDDADLSRRRRRQAKARDRAGRERGPWPTRLLAGLSALLLVGALVVSALLLDARRDLAEAREFTETWTELSVQEDARMVPGLSDNGTWRAVITDDRAALWAEGVSEYEPDGDQDEVLQLWGERDGHPVDLGVLEVPRNGTIQVIVPEGVERLHVTREHAPQNRSGTPSERVVANLDPELSGT